MSKLGKIQYLSASKIVIQPEKFNPARFRSGQAYGVSVKDNYDIPKMMNDIFHHPDGPGIKTEIHVLQRGKEYILFRGFTRMLAVQEFRKMGEMEVAARYGDAVKAKALFESFDAIPAVAHESTGDDERDLDYILRQGNDQDQQEYSETGLIRSIWWQQDRGRKYEDIVQYYGAQLLRLTSQGRTNLAKVKLEPDAIKKVTMMREALRGRLKNEILLANQLGDRVRKAFFSLAAYNDGLSSDMPEFKANRKNLETLNSAKNEDGVNWHPDRGGPVFNAAIQSIIDDEAKPAQPKGPKKPSVEEATLVLKDTKSNAAREVLQWTQGVKGTSPDRIKAFDAIAYRGELTEAAWLKVKDKLTNAAAIELCNAIFRDDPLQLETTLAKYC